MKMRISDSVAKYILDLLNQENGTAEIQRNELASYLGCVPSQINYVLTSRFTPGTGVHRRKPAGRRRIYPHYPHAALPVRYDHAHCQQCGGQPGRRHGTGNDKQSAAKWHAGPKRGRPYPGCLFGTRLGRCAQRNPGHCPGVDLQKYAVNHQNPIRRDGYAVSSLRKEDCYHSY